jgi:hypothetical protein
MPELGLVVVEMVRSDDALPPAQLVFGRDAVLDFCLRALAAVMRLRGQRP